MTPGIEIRLSDTVPQGGYRVLSVDELQAAEVGFLQTEIGESLTLLRQRWRAIYSEDYDEFLHTGDQLDKVMLGARLDVLDSLSYQNPLPEIYQNAWAEQLQLATCRYLPPLATHNYFSCSSDGPVEYFRQVVNRGAILVAGNNLAFSDVSREVDYDAMPDKTVPWLAIGRVRDVAEWFPRDCGFIVSRKSVDYAPSCIEAQLFLIRRDVRAADASLKRQKTVATTAPVSKADVASFCLAIIWLNRSLIGSDYKADIGGSYRFHHVVKELKSQLGLFDRLGGKTGYRYTKAYLHLVGVYARSREASRRKLSAVDSDLVSWLEAECRSKPARDYLSGRKTSSQIEDEQKLANWGHRKEFLIKKKAKERSKADEKNQEGQEDVKSDATETRDCDTTGSTAEASGEV